MKSRSAAEIDVNQIKTFCEGLGRFSVQTLLVDLFPDSTVKEDYLRVFDSDLGLIERAYSLLHELRDWRDTFTAAPSELSGDPIWGEVFITIRNWLRLNRHLLIPNQQSLKAIFSPNPFSIISLAALGDNQEMAEVIKAEESLNPESKSRRILYQSIQALIADLFYEGECFKQVLQSRLDPKITAELSLDENESRSTTPPEADDSEQLYFYYERARSGDLCETISLLDGLTPYQFGSFILGVYHALSKQDLNYVFELTKKIPRTQLLPVLEAVTSLAPYHLNAKRSHLFPVHGSDNKQGAQQQRFIKRRELECLLPTFNPSHVMQSWKQQEQLEKDCSIFLSKGNTQHYLKIFQSFTYIYSSSGVVEEPLAQLRELNTSLLHFLTHFRLNFTFLLELSDAYEKFIELEERLYSEASVGTGGFGFEKIYRPDHNRMPEFTETEWLANGCFQPLLFDTYYLLRELCIVLTEKFYSHLISDVIKSGNVSDLENKFEDIPLMRWGWLVLLLQREFAKQDTPKSKASIRRVDEFLIEQYGLDGYLHFTYPTESSLVSLSYCDPRREGSSPFFYCLARTSKLAYLPDSKWQIYQLGFLHGVFAEFFLQANSKLKINDIPRKKINQLLKDLEQLPAYQLALKVSLGEFPKLKELVPKIDFEKVLRNFENHFALKKFSMYAVYSPQEEERETASLKVAPTTNSYSLS